MRGRFLSYWQQHGGLAQFGLPLTEQFYDNPDSIFKPQGLLVQHFERAVFEYQPENQPPNDVLLTLLGSQAYKQKYPDGAPNQLASRSNPYYFAATGKTLGGNFRAYWEGHGGLAVQGYPLSDEFSEVSSVDGRSYTVQYFERAVFELHPENAGTPYEVLLTQLGTSSFRRLLLNTNLAALDVMSDGTAWAGGQRGMVLKLQQGRWVVSSNIQTTELIYAVSIVAPTEVRISRGIIYHLVSGIWQQEGNTESVYAIDMVSATAGWAVSGARGGIIYRYNNNHWIIERGPLNNTPTCIDMLTLADGWVGSTNGFYHYDGVNWQQVQQATYSYIRDLSMTSAQSGWAVASGKDKLYHYDSTSWQPVTSPVDQPLNSIQMLNGSTGWAVGANGTILHYDGTSWQQQASPTINNLNAVKMVSANEGWAVGDAGTILHYQNGVWSVYNF